MTPKQARFVEEYLKDLNATQAALRTGYSAKSAYSQGQRMLKDREVEAAVEAAREKRSQKAGIDAAWLLERLAAEATADAADLYDEAGNLKHVKDWPLIWRQGLVQGIEVEQIGDVGSVRKIKLDSRVKRLELIGKHIGVKAFSDIVEHKGLDGLAARLARASERG